MHCPDSTPSVIAIVLVKAAGPWCLVLRFCVCKSITRTRANSLAVSHTAPSHPPLATLPGLTLSGALAVAPRAHPCSFRRTPLSEGSRRVGCSPRAPRMMPAKASSCSPVPVGESSQRTPNPPVNDIALRRCRSSTSLVTVSSSYFLSQYLPVVTSRWCWHALCN